MPLGRAFCDRAEIELPMRRVAPGRRLLAVEERRQRAAVEMRRRRLAKQVEQRRHDVDRFGEAVDPAPAALLAARIADDQRDVKAAVEEAAFAEHEMVAHHLGMVGGEDDDRVVPGAGCLDRCPDAAELRVDLRDHAVVDRADLRGTRPRPKSRTLPFAPGRKFRLSSAWRARSRDRDGLAASSRQSPPRRKAGPSAGSYMRVVGFRHDEGRMRADEGEMREPGRALLLLAKPADEFAGQERRRRLVRGIDRRRVGDGLAGAPSPGDGCRDSRREESTPRAASQDSQGFWCSGRSWRTVKPGSTPS